MNNRNAIIIAIIVGTVFGFIYFNVESNDKNLEKVSIERVIDGDTLELDDGRRIRLLNINTPEKGESGSSLAKDFLREFEGRQVELDNAGTEKYGRTLGRIYSDERYLNLEIVRLGYAHYFLVDENEIGDFKNAQKEAYYNERGIWKRSRYFGCVNVEIDKEKEFVYLNKICNNSWVGWTIKDETTRKFVFKHNFNQRFILYSSQGNSNGTSGYWNRGNVWNDDKDSIFIRDKDGLLVYYDSYGY